MMRGLLNLSATHILNRYIQHHPHSSTSIHSTSRWSTLPYSLEANRCMSAVVRPLSLSRAPSAHFQTSTTLLTSDQINTTKPTLPYNMASSTSASTSNNVWLITGCSSGIGRQLAIAARKRGDLVIATARKVETLDDLKKLGCEALALDISASADTVKQVIDKAHGFYGRIDILVNNAGDTTVGAIEEANDDETLKLFDTNVFGHLRVTRAVLSYMREKKSGIIANIGSGAGYFPVPVNSLYGAAKYALAGVTQSLAIEVAHLGIEVTLIEPGMFKTRDMTHLNVFEQSIADYDPVKKAVQEQLAAGFGIPPQNPAKGAEAIVEALTKTGRCAGRALPRRMPLGGELRPLMEAELATRTKELNDWAIFTSPETFAFDA